MHLSVILSFSDGVVKRMTKVIGWRSDGLLIIVSKTAREAVLMLVEGLIMSNLKRVFILRESYL